LQFALVINIGWPPCSGDGDGGGDVWTIFCCDPSAPPSIVGGTRR